MSDFFEQSNSISELRWEYTLEFLPANLTEDGEIEELYIVLTDFEFIGAKIDEPKLGPQRLIEDYNLALNFSIEAPEVSELELYRNFIQKHIQRLTKYRGLLFTLIYHEGFPAAQAKAQELASQGLWTKPWLRTTLAWTPTSEVNVTTERIEILKQWTFEASSASVLAKERQLAFFVKRLGQIGVVDIESGYELPQMISTRHFRILGVFSSSDAQHLAIAYENGEADLLRLAYNRNGVLVSSTKKIEYLVPEYEAPIMEFIGNFLWYQTAAGPIARLHLMSGETSLMFSGFSSDADKGASGMVHSLNKALAKSLKSLLQRLNLNTTKVNATFRGELSGIGALLKHYVITLRYGSDTYMVILDESGPVTSLRCAKTDVTCLCTNDRQFAVAFTNHKLAVFDTLSGIVQLCETKLNELPACMVWNDNKIVWISEKGTLHNWNVDVSREPYNLDGGGSVFLTARGLVMRPNRTFAMVSATAALCFAIIQRDEKQPYQIQAVFEAGAKQAYYAIQKRENGVWVLDSASKKEIWIEREIDSSNMFSMDGANHLFGAGISGPGMLIDIATHNINPVIQTPYGVTSVVGDPNAGFWLTDGSGAVHFVDPDYTCQKSGQPDLKVWGMPQLHCWPGLVVWSGLVLDQTEFGVDMLYALVFFEPNGRRHGRLRQIGQRLFAVSDGSFQTLTYDSKRNRLLVVWQFGSRFKHSVKFGTPQDFINKSEQEKEIIGVDHDVLVAKVTTDGRGLYMLCQSGNLFRLDAETFDVQAVLSGSIPLTGMSQGIVQDASLVLIEGGSRLFFCEFERSPSI